MLPEEERKACNEVFNDHLRRQNNEKSVYIVEEEEEAEGDLFPFPPLTYPPRRPTSPPPRPFREASPPPRPTGATTPAPDDLMDFEDAVM
jgi:hypothetical protein